MIADLERKLKKAKADCDLLLIKQIEKKIRNAELWGEQVMKEYE